VNDDPSDEVIFGTSNNCLAVLVEEVQSLLTGLGVSVTASGEIIP
jgi:hypothetical protein